MKRRGWTVWTGMVAVLLTVVGCGGADETAEVDVDRYVVRAEVTSLSLDATPPMVSLHHEAIPDFRDVATGEVTGMMSMAMAFTLESAELADGVAVGDKVQATFEVRPESEWPMVITGLKPLPPDTDLDFGMGAGENGEDAMPMEPATP